MNSTTINLTPELELPADLQEARVRRDFKAVIAYARKIAGPKDGRDLERDVVGWLMSLNQGQRNDLYMRLHRAGRLVVTTRDDSKESPERPLSPLGRDYVEKMLALHKAKGVE